MNNGKIKNSHVHTDDWLIIYIIINILYIINTIHTYIQSYYKLKTAGLELNIL